MAFWRRISTGPDYFLSPTNRNWLTILSGDVGRLLLGFVPSVLIARALSPVGYGYFALLGLAAGIGNVLADLGLSQAGVQRIAAQSDDIARTRAQTFFWLRLGAAALLVGLGLIIAPWLAAGLGLPPDGVFWLQLAFAGVLATTASGAIATLLQAAGRFSQISWLLLLNTGLTALLAIGLFSTGRLDLTAALLWLGILPALLTFAWGRRQLPPTWRLNRPASLILRTEAGHLLRFGRWLWLANLLALLGQQLDLLLLNQLSSAEALGHYGLALNLANKADILNRSLYTVLLPAAATLASSGIHAYLRAGLRRSLLLAGLLLPALWVVPPAVRLFYGAEFEPAGPLFQLLLVIVLFDVFALPLMLLPFTLRRPHWLALADGLRLALFLPAALLFIPVLGPAGAVLARGGARLAGIGLVAFLVWRRRPQVPIPTLDVSTGYARWADTYPPEAHNPLMAAEQAAVLSLLPAADGLQCLDLACGSGRYQRLLLARGAAVVWGTDFSPEMLAKAENSDGSLVQARLFPLPFADAAFDLVVCGLAVGHEPDLDRTLAAASRVLRPGGTIVYSDFHPQATASGRQRTFTTATGQTHAIKQYLHGPADHRRALAAAGLSLTAMVDVPLASETGPADDQPFVLVLAATKRRP